MEAQRYWPQLGMFELWIWCRFIIGRFLKKKLSCPLLSSSFCTWSSSKGRRNVKSGSQDGDACSGLAAFGPRVTTVVLCKYSTLHGTNISHLMTFLSRWFSFSPRWDMDLFRGGLNSEHSCPAWSSFTARLCLNCSSCAMLEPDTTH